MAEDFGFVADAPTSSDEFGFVPETSGLSVGQQVLADQKAKAAAYPRMGKFPSSALNTVGDIAAAPSYGAVQEAGRVPGGLLESAIRAIQQYNRTFSPEGGIGGAYSAPSTEALNQAVLNSIQPVQDLTPKVFEAAGVPTNFPTSPQFTYPRLAAVGENIPFWAPAKSLSKGLINLGRSSEALDFGRAVRTAVKPANAQVGERVETAANNQLSDIFHANPNADKAAATPFEGFANSVSAVKQNVEGQLDAVRARIGGTLNGGDQIAAALEDQAALLKRRGEPAASVQALMDRANDFKGKSTNIGDLQGSVTLANQKQAPFFQKNLVSQSPALANAENVANKIISQTGGKIINDEMATVGGAEAAGLRKQWADLTTLEHQSLEQLNKLLNKAPPEIQSAAVAALTSAKGVAGLYGVLNGHPSAVVGIGSAVLEKFQKNAAKELGNSNSIISKTYEALRKSPPKAPQAFTLPPAAVGNPATAQDLANIKMAQSAVFTPPAPIASTGASLDPVIQSIIDRNAAMAQSTIPLGLPQPSNLTGPILSPVVNPSVVPSIGQPASALEQAIRNANERQRLATLSYFK